MTAEEWLVISTIALVVATGGLMVVAFLQRGWMKKHAEHLEALTNETKAIAEAAKDSASAARDSVELARTSLHQVERPWLTFDVPMFQMAGGGIDSNPTSFLVKVINAGKSPAIIRSTVLRVELGSPPRVQSNIPKDAGGYALGPGLEKTFTLASPSMAELRNSASAYLVCRIEYEDVLSQDPMKHVSADVWMRSSSDGNVIHVESGPHLEAELRQFT